MILLINLFILQRTGKTSACGVVKIQDSSPRPDRLISRLKIVSVDESAPRLTVIRSPKGPDGTKGFHLESRAPRISGNNFYALYIHET